MITAGFAAEQGKTVYALPGPVNEPLSAGCHKLIYDGAGIAYSPEILLAEWGISPEIPKNSKKKTKLVLETDMNLVYSCLDLRPKNLNAIMEKTGLSPDRTGALLVELELMGLVRESSRHYYVRQGQGQQQ